ncbi:hypothetical protein FA95DRAFT_1529376 [Auriscalpium vulgare]|uniref:Uncharacterized protein n=1 Tax=Auriscalpium vulgare TaxID=40419 RepID=A0ACB8R1Q2_9AGAM|nr:hypothetical protein FA95DRAFT_1529376 [Auriscalpium vulgare]
MVGHTKNAQKKRTRPRLRLPAVVSDSVPGLTPLPGRLLPPAGGSRGNAGQKNQAGSSKRSSDKQFVQFQNLNKSLLRTALDNAVTIPVDIRKLAEVAAAGSLTNEDVDSLLEDELSHLPVQPTFYNDQKPRSFFDVNGVLIAFHFPGYLSEKASRQHEEYLDDYANAFPPKLSADKQGRGAKEGYRTEAGIKTGCTHISPGWHEIGHPKDHPLPSGSYAGTKKHAAATLVLLAKLKAFQRRIDHLVKIATPDPYRAFTEAMNHLRASKENALHAANWYAPFQGISIIYNRETPSHRDDKGCISGVDALLSVGRYTDCRLDLDVLRTCLSYDTGTLILLLGYIIPHKVSSWSAGGERKCLVHFTHQHLLDTFGVEKPHFTTLQELRSLAAYDN